MFVVCITMLGWHAGAEDIHQKKRQTSSGKKPSPREILKAAYRAEATSGDLKTPDAATELPQGSKAKAVGEQLEGSMPAESAAQPIAQTSMPAGDAAVGDVEVGGLPTSTEVEEMTQKQKKRQREGENDSTASQLGLAGVSQSPSVPLSSKVRSCKSGALLGQHSPQSNFQLAHMLLTLLLYQSLLAVAARQPASWYSWSCSLSCIVSASSC